MTSPLQPSRQQRVLLQVASSEIWSILAALMLIFYVAPKYYGTETVLAFLSSKHLTPLILMGVALWVAGMLLQSVLLKRALASTNTPKRQSSLWLPIKAAFLVIALWPISGLQGSLLTHLLYQWVTFVSA